MSRGKSDLLGNLRPIMTVERSRRWTTQCPSKQGKYLVSCHKKASVAEIRTENKTVGEGGGGGTYTLKTTSHVVEGHVEL